ncbi:hypothetical protein FHS57_002531 [Runella defluvii]|uniref:Uncharacterized protein n=1 Tax=Runella defluvii TaxID=370973 RepID=A0A7W5ZME1_9BACT|nr:hypothetical protein [Runella defluvii]
MLLRELITALADARGKEKEKPRRMAVLTGLLVVLN